MSTFTAIETKLRSILYDPRLNREGIRQGIEECGKAVRTMNAAMKQVKTMGEKQHIAASLGQVKSYRQLFKGLQVTGGDLEPAKETAKHRVRWEDTATAFKNRVKTGTIVNLKHKDVENFLDDSKALLRRRVANHLKTWEAIKINIVLSGLFSCIRAEQEIEDIKYFPTRNFPIYKNDDIDEWFDSNIKQPLLTKLEEFQEMGSGWTLKEIINVQVNINKHQPMHGSSYIPLPPSIAAKHACVNVKNDDNACFAWAVVSALHPAEAHSDRMSSYPHYSSVLNLEGLRFPMAHRQISRFEKQNDISINVYLLKKSKKYKAVPIYLTKNKQEKHVNLLMVSREHIGINSEVSSQCSIDYHYVWIKDLSRLLSTQINTKHCKKYFCDRCLHYFYSQEKLNSHLEDCKNQNTGKVRLPFGDDAILTFKEYKNKEKQQFVIYADLENILKPIEDKNMYQEHVPAAIGYYVKCSYDDSLSYYKAYRGEDCIEWFCREIDELASKFAKIHANPHDMDPLTPEQQETFKNATLCHICEKPFTEDDIKVRDHFHMATGTNNKGDNTSNYRGPAHDSCNLQLRDSRVVPVIFHNLSGYDAHFIVKTIAATGERLDILPINKEKYISFTVSMERINKIIKFRFIDSFRFMNKGLADLVANLEHDHLKITKQHFPNEEQFKLVTRKGVYPYDYMSSFEKFEETQLPDIDEFHSRLEERNCSMKLYVHAKNVWEKFNIQNLGEYTDLYLKTDILLLADVFEEFRRGCHSTYDLDPAHYFTLPGYTWACMLKYTGVQLELLENIDQLLFIEKGIRGGLSQCSKRRISANNKYMPHYDSTKEDVYIQYYDLNNQYGYAQSQFLPYGGFKWEYSPIDVMKVSDDSPVGYIMEVNLEYPVSLHDKHKDLPICPSHAAAPNSKEKKLLATLHNKEKYVIHYRALKQAIALGLKVTKVHRILKFNQSAWLKPYIDLNTELRKRAANEFEKDLFKLANNAVFGKTMENIRNHTNVKLVSVWDGRYGAEARLANPNLKSWTIFDEKLMAIELTKSETYFNKPIYIGMSILDIAKTTIYDFHYGYMMKRYGSNCTAAYTDTDGIIYEIRNQDPYLIVKEDCHERFDTSDYPANNRWGIPQVNKKVLGLMKDENSGKIVTDFAGLRAKLYTVRVLPDSEERKRKRDQLEGDGCDQDEIETAVANVGITKKAKGVKKTVIRNKITFDDYVKCLDNYVTKHVSQNLIRSDKHAVFTVVQEKLALSPHDDKRYLIKNSYESLPWGHYSIMNAKSCREEEPTTI